MTSTVAASSSIVPGAADTVDTQNPTTTSNMSDAEKIIAPCGNNDKIIATTTTKKKQHASPRKIIRRVKTMNHNQPAALLLPAHIQNNTQLHHIISTTLPKDYEFEIPKTIARIEKMNATSIALQLPEGLTMYASTIADILMKFTYRFQPSPTAEERRRRLLPQPLGDQDDDLTGGGRNNHNKETIQHHHSNTPPIQTPPKQLTSISILGDVTYGACCIDDLSARALGCELLIHYGHSCLVPLTCTVLPCLYVFVEIRVDTQHLVDCIRLTFWEEMMMKKKIKMTTKMMKENKMMMTHEGKTHKSDPQSQTPLVVSSLDEIGPDGEKFMKNICCSNSSSPPQESSQRIIIEALIMGTVQFRSTVIEVAQRLNDGAVNSTTMDSSNHEDIQFHAIVPQAKPLSPGEVLGCTAPSGLATLDFAEAMSSVSSKHSRQQQQARRNNDKSNERCSSISTTTAATDALAAATETIDTPLLSSSSSPPSENPSHVPATRERVMIFIADGRFHLEAAMISNPTLRALRYDPYSKTLTEERYDTIQMKKLRREAILSVRRIFWGDEIAFSTQTPPNEKIFDVRCVHHNTSDSIAKSVLPRSTMALQPSFSKLTLSSYTSASNDDDINYSNQRKSTKIFGIILGTLGRQGNPSILSRIRSLLHKRNIRTTIILLSEIFPKKLELMSNTAGGGGGGVCAWVQIACPRLSIDWGHYFCVPVLSPYELFVAMGEVVDASLLSEGDETRRDEQGMSNSELDDGRVHHENGYPMDFYSKSGGPWSNYYNSNSGRKMLSYGS